MPSIDPIDRAVNFALGQVGKQFKPGEQGQCANFLRYVFAAAQVDVGEAKTPTDLKYMPGMPLAPSFANSFAGDEIGPRVARKDVRKGDIVLFPNTYGNYPAGVITHVGLAVSNVDMVDRSTADAPVKLRGIDTFRFGEARRPLAYGNVDGVRRLKHFFHPGKPGETIVDDDTKLDPTVLLDFTEKVRHLVINGRDREIVSIDLDIKFKDAA